MKINFKNTANIPSFYNKVDRKDFSIVSSNFYIFVSCYYKYPSHWIFPLLFTNFHIPCISSILFSLYIIFFFHGIFSIFIFQNLLYIYTYIFSSRYKIFPFNIVSLRMYTYISHWTRNLLIFISRNSSSWIFLSEGQGSFSFFFFLILSKFFQRSNSRLYPI